MATPNHRYQTRNHRDPVYALKGPLQIKRDVYGSKIKHTWLPQNLRPHFDPRSIQLPTGAYSVRCFQNVVHQSLMHVPRFLNWICSHTNCELPAQDCVPCLYSDFVARYWGAATTVIPANDASLDRIAVLARMANPAFTAYGDAAEFYEWVVDRFTYSIPVGATSQWRAVHWKNVMWNREWEALFLWDFTEQTQCHTCHDVEEQDSWESMIRVAFNPMQMANLDQLLDVGFFNQRPQNQCTTCSAATPHRVERRIRAAPQVLRIEVQLTNVVAGQLTKQLHPWDVPEQLDLTQYQQNAELPLQYSLSSAIAHAGSNGNREVGGIAWASNEETEGSFTDSDEFSARADNVGNLLVAQTREELEEDRREIERSTRLFESMGVSFNGSIGEEQVGEDSSSEESSSEEEESTDEDNGFGSSDEEEHSPRGDDSQEPGDEGVSDNQEPSDDDTPTEGDLDETEDQASNDSQPPSGQASIMTDQYVRAVQGEALGDNISHFNGPIKEVPSIQQIDKFMQQRVDAHVEEHIATPRIRTRSCTASMDTSPHTPEQGRNKRRRVGPLAGLVEVTREEYISELGPDLSDTPEVPKAPKKARSQYRALYRRDVEYISPTPSPPQMGQAIAGHVTVGSSDSDDAEDDVEAFAHTAATQARPDRNQAPVFNIAPAAPTSNSAIVPAPLAPTSNSAIVPAPLAPTPHNPTVHDPNIPNNGWSLGDRRTGGTGGTGYRAGEKYWTLDPAPHQHGTHVVNVRGKLGNFHVGNNHLARGNHVVQLGPGELGENPQRPEHSCYRPTGFQVVVLTYTRNRLTGALGKQERMIV